MRTTAVMSQAQNPPQDEGTNGELSEGELLDAVVTGDRGAASELVERTYGRVFATLYRLCGGDSELAADLTQETFRRAWESLSGFDRRARLSTWLFRVAYNAFLNHVRRPQRVVPLSDAVADRATDPSPGPEESVYRVQTLEAVRRAVLDLPGPLQETVAARYWGEVSVREIALLEGISQVAVRKRLRKALRVLGDALEVRS